jgi:hypothetical protein
MALPQLLHAGGVLLPAPIDTAVVIEPLTGVIAAGDGLVAQRAAAW